MRLVADERWSGAHGIGRFATEVISRLRDPELLGIGGSPTRPIDCVRLTRHFLRRRERVFFTPGISIPFTWPKDVVVVPTIHDLIPIHVADESSVLKRLYFSTVLLPGCRRTPKIFTVSEVSRQEIAAWARIDVSRIVNVGNGISRGFSPTGTVRVPGYPYVLYVGNRRPHKNIPLLLRAVASMENTEIRLALTGEADAHFDAAVSRFGLRGRVEFLGVLDEPGLAEAYRGARVLVMPSNYEGFGLPVIEAMACGTPVVSTDSASLPEVVGDAGMLVRANDAVELAHTLDQVVSDETLRLDLIARGLARAGQFSWDAVAAKVQRSLDEFL